jgi:general stress protein 26
MHTPQELEKKFWKAIKSDMTVMLGLADTEHGHARPMTAQVEGERGPIWFFTSTDSHLVERLTPNSKAAATFTSKGHDLFACIHGTLTLDSDRAVIDRLWNPFVAAWYEGGKDDPKLALIRMDAEHAQIWLNANSLLAGIKLLFGVDPKQDYKDMTADVELH